MAVQIPKVSKSTRKVMVDFVVIGDFDKVETIGQYQVEIDVKQVEDNLPVIAGEKQDPKKSLIESILKVVKSWDLQGEDDEVLPIDEEAITNLLNLHAPAFRQLKLAIEAVQIGWTQAEYKEAIELGKRQTLKN